MNPTRSVLCGLAAASLVVASAGAWASTWQWRDAQGRMVYSDRPPSTDVRPSQILRSPAAVKGGTAAQSSMSSSSPSGEPFDAAQGEASPTASSAATRATSEEGLPKASPAPAPASPTWVERERAFRKRQAEREENAAKEREENERTASAKRACEGAQREIRLLESGMRVASLNARGEPEVLDDAQRERRLKSVRADFGRLCGGR